MFTWLEYLADKLIYGAFALSPESALGSALHFFVYDSVKIFLLILVVTLFMGIINSYFPIEKLRAYLQKNKLYGSEYLLASVFGAITPFCSCSSVPLFVGFVQGGIPLGVTFSFLITSPLVNEVALALFIGMFGWKVTLIYGVTGVVLGSVGGWVLGKLNMEKELSSWVQDLIAKKKGNTQDVTVEDIPFKERLPGIWDEAFGIVKEISLYVIIGIGIGAVMHGYVPEGFFQAYLAGDQWWTIPLAVVFAVPLYGSSAGIIPVIQVLVSKGIPFGTAIAFMMGAIGLSLPEATLLKKVMNIKLITIFFGVVTLFIIASGFLFNWMVII